MIKTSVIIPVYNTAEYVKECIDSIYAQTLQEIEVIAINDGSTDESLQILHEIKKEYPKLIVISQENQGQGQARNAGVEIAKGKYVYFIDSDDCLKKDALEKCYAFSEEKELDILMFDAEIFGNTDSYKENPYNRSKKIKSLEVWSGCEFIDMYFNESYCPSPCLIFLRRSFLVENKIKFLPKVYYEDNEFYIHVMSIAERVMYISDCFYLRRIRENSVMTSVFDLRRAQDYLTVIRSMVNSVKEIEPPANKVLIKTIVNLLANLTYNCKENDLFGKLSSLSKAIREIAFDLCCDENADYFLTDQLYKICIVLPQGTVSSKLWNKINSNKDRFLNNMLSELPLNLKNVTVGIYGIGKYTERFINEYVRCVGDIQSEYVFIDSYIETKTQEYYLKPVYNVKDIKELPLDYIIISSQKYEVEMKDTLLNMYGKKYSVICLKSDYQF